MATDTRIQKFVDSLRDCLYAGEVEMKIFMDFEQKKNVLYFTTESYGRGNLSHGQKFKVTVELDKGKA